MVCAVSTQMVDPLSFWMLHLLQQSLNVFLLFKDDIDVSLGRRWRVILPRPLDANGSELSEGLHKTVLSHVPWDAAQEDFAGVDRVLVCPGRQLAGPGTGGVVES